MTIVVLPVRATPNPVSALVPTCTAPALKTPGRYRTVYTCSDEYTVKFVARVGAASRT